MPSSNASWSRLPKKELIALLEQRTGAGTEGPTEEPAGIHQSPDKQPTTPAKPAPASKPAPVAKPAPAPKPVQPAAETTPNSKNDKVAAMTEDSTPTDKKRKTKDQPSSTHKRQDRKEEWRDRRRSRSPPRRPTDRPSRSPSRKPADRTYGESLSTPTPLGTQRRLIEGYLSSLGGVKRIEALKQFPSGVWLWNVVQEVNSQLVAENTDILQRPHKHTERWHSDTFREAEREWKVVKEDPEFLSWEAAATVERSLQFLTGKYSESRTLTLDRFLQDQLYGDYHGIFGKDCLERAFNRLQRLFGEARDINEEQKSYLLFRTLRDFALTIKADAKDIVETRLLEVLQPRILDLQKLVHTLKTPKMKFIAIDQGDAAKA